MASNEGAQQAGIATIGDLNRALSLAALNGDDDEVVRLLRDGARVDYADAANKRTPLMKAAMKGHESTVRLLLDHGAKLDCVDSQNKTAHDWAQYSHPAIKHLLIPPVPALPMGWKEIKDGLE